MGQMPFAMNLDDPGSNAFISINAGSLSFFPLQVYESVSFNTLNMIVYHNATQKTLSYYIGLYSLNGSTLSLANTVSATFTHPNNANVGRYISFSNTSATQNITPGTWWVGFLASTAGSNNISLRGANNQNPSNAFPGAFYGGAMTASTNALPASIATSDLDITGSDAIAVPFICISA
ncbi:hypothetical protein A2V80_03520 [Candidatus Woesebacteria bacterium RBG_16_39_8b]|uniref:Uncharacterized protein n=1 Tax=Candidatus Woesebacteria bacterium RBG_16_39_8b TaxID=1802482 RepID=A0A1F7XBQ0_9BACT|nr:MAG: hypothetical protein A2V80_03520 [Candidatus Woesebacteria bacterium RBG_16_39_8b]